MLKKNLIAIAIITLGLVMASNAFGQRGGTEKRPDKNNPDFNKNEHAIKPIQVEREEILIDGMRAIGDVVKVSGGKFDNNSQTSRTSKTQNKNCQEFESVIQSPQDIASGKATGIKSKSKTTAQYNPKEIGIDKVSRRKNLGDTGTHEVGSKQRKRGRN